MVKKYSEDGRKSQQKNDITEEIKQYGLQIGYALNKWGSLKTIELMMNVPAYIFGKNLTPEKVIHQIQENADQNLQSENIIAQEQQQQQLRINNSNSNNIQNDLNKNEDNINKNGIKTDQKQIEEIETEKERREKQKEMLAIYKNTILFTYRKNFQALLEDAQGNPEVKNLTSDSGWGCMIRAGQMIFAQAMKKHLKKTNIIDIHHLTNIIIGFLEDDENERHPYSIHAVTKQAYKKYQILPGAWYTPIQICYILKDLHKKKQMKGTENLKIAVHGSDKPIVFEKILHTMISNKKKISCNHDKQISKSSMQNQDNSDDSFEKIESCTENQFAHHESESEEQIQDNEIDNLCCKDCYQTNNKLLLLIPCRIGLDEISPPHIEIIKRLMSIENSIGMIGGKPNKAHYFVGYINNELLYLDPHWIQESFQYDQLIQNLQGFFPSDVLKIKINKISTSLVFGFYFGSVLELNNFYKQMRQLEKEFKDDFFLVIEKSAPSYDYCTSSEIKKLQNKYKNQYEDQILTDLGIDKNQYVNCDEALDEDDDDDDDLSSCDDMMEQYDDDEDNKYDDYSDYLRKQQQQQQQQSQKKQLEETSQSQQQQQQIQNQQQLDQNQQHLNKSNQEDQDLDKDNIQNKQYLKQGNQSTSVKKLQLIKHQSDEDLQKLKSLYYQSNSQNYKSDDLKNSNNNNN